MLRVVWLVLNSPQSCRQSCLNWEVVLERVSQEPKNVCRPCARTAREGFSKNYNYNSFNLSFLSPHLCFKSVILAGHIVLSTSCFQIMKFICWKLQLKYNSSTTCDDDCPFEHDWANVALCEYVKSASKI